MTRPIRWEIIEQNYDMLVKYATAIRVGTASTEAILRRFTRNASHPASSSTVRAMATLVAVNLSLVGRRPARPNL